MADVPKHLQGVPAVGFETLLEMVGLATSGMLKPVRRRPADGQTPAYRYWTGHAWAPLYRLADTVALPPLSPGRQARWDAARTCRRCSKRSDYTFAVGADGQRYCEPCQEPAAKAWWEAERAAERAAAGAWAREVLADPATMLIAGQRLSAYRRVLAVDLTGAVLLDVKVPHPYYADNLASMPADLREELVDAASVEHAAIELTYRRLIPWWTSHDVGALQAILSDTGRPPPAPGADLVRDGDAFGDRYSRWVGERTYPQDSYRYRQGLRQQNPPGEFADRPATMRALLDQMAATPATPAAALEGGESS